MIYSPPMASTRSQVLQRLLSQQRCTINDLASAVKINPISVRHHIGRLEEEGLVNSAEERHGVGRPRRVYFLTEAGMEHFPARTIHFTNRLLDQLKHHFPGDTVEKIFTGLAESVTDGKPGPEELGKLSLDERLKLIKNWLTAEGYTVKVERNENEVIITETSCPYYYVGQTHAEVCSIDKALIARALSADPQRTTCLLNGDSHCTYIVPMAAIKETSSN